MAVVSRAFMLPFVDRPVICRLCLSHPSRSDALQLAVGFRVYHDVKLARRDEFLNLLRNHDTPTLALLSKEIAVGAYKIVAAL